MQTHATPAAFSLALVGQAHWSADVAPTDAVVAAMGHAEHSPAPRSL